MRKLAILLALVLAMTCFSALAENLPITEETYTFTMMIDATKTYDGEFFFYDILEEQTNVHVDLNLVPYEIGLEKLGIMFTTGEYPDVIAGWLLGQSDIINEGMNNGIFIPLEEYFEDCPNITEVLNIGGVRESMTLPDGHIYTIPYVVGEPEATFKPYINQVWLENLGLEMPTTTEELKEVLIAFRDLDANGNGDPTDEIPFSGDPNNLKLAQFAGWFGIDAFNGGSFPYFTMTDGKLQFAANTDAYREFLEYFADLWAEGLLDPELFTQDSSMAKAKAHDDIVGVFLGYGPGDWCDDFNEDTDADKIEKYGPNYFTYLPVIAGCENPVWHRNSYGVTLFRTQLALTNNCDEEKASIICRWVDNLFTNDNSRQSCNGVFGVMIEKVSEGVYRNLDTSSYDAEYRDQQGWGHVFTQSMPRYYHDDVVLAAGSDELPAPTIMDLADEAYGPYLGEMFKAVWGVDADKTARASQLSTDITNYCNTMMAQFISGEVELSDDNWTKYCAQIEAYGLEELTDLDAESLGCDIY